MTPGDPKQLVVNADDFGLTEGVCDGILEAFDRGVVTSTSALVVAPAFDVHAARLRQSGLPTGVHLCAVGEDPPLCAPADVPSLVDSAGRFAADWRQFLARMLSGRIKRDDLEREFTAQIELLLSHGIKPTHLDAHQHLHLLPGMTGVALDLAQRYQIPAIRVIRTTAYRPLSLVVEMLAAITSLRGRRRGLLVPHAAAGLEQAGQMHTEVMLESLRSLASSCSAKPTGLADLTVHPGAASDPARSRYKWNYHWSAELDSLCDPRILEEIRDLGFTLVSYADLAPRNPAGPLRN